TALMGTGTSLVLNRVLVTKVYFTRLALPLSASATPLIDLAVSMVVLLALMAWYGGGGIGGVAIAAASIGTLMITAWAVGLTLAAVLAWYRDLKQGLPFVLQAWMFLGPVVYDIDPWGDSASSWLAWLNPVAGSIMAFRAGVTGAEVPWLVWGWSVLVSVIGLWLALLLFSWLEEEMGDVI
ncbi:MAG: ABC transporter permease, partial [Planctomycetota bacterium]